MEANPRLRGVPRSRPTLIFRALVTALKAAPELQCVRTWKSWQSEDEKPLQPPSYAQAPLIRLTPILAGEGTRDNLSQRGQLTVDVLVSVPGWCVDDAMDLFSQIINVVYPADQSAETSFRQDLRLLGAIGTSVSILRPATIDITQSLEGILSASGQLGITYRIQG